MWYELSKMSLKKYIVRTIAITCILLILGNILLYLNPNNNFDNDYGISIYFGLISINRNIIFLITYTLLLPGIILIDYYDYAINKFDYMIIQRIGVNQYYKRALENIFVITFFATLFINLCLLICIGFIWSNISFTPQYIYELFSQDTFKNIVCYLFFCSIGTSFFSMFMFSIIDFIKNKYVYRGFIPILIFTTIIFCTFIFPFLSGIGSILFKNLLIFKTIIFSFVPSGLLTPGMIYESYGFLNFGCSFLIYFVCFVVSTKISKILRRKNG